LIYKELIFFLFIAVFLSCDRENNVGPIVDDGFPPAIPTGVNVWRQYDGQIGIEWIRNLEPGLKGFNIYRSITDTINFSNIAFTNDDYYLDNFLEYDSTYNYKVTAIDIFSRESEFSMFVSGKPINRFKPNTLFDLNINARNWNDSLSIFLNWIPREDPDIFGYEIYRDTVAEFDTSAAKLKGFSTSPEYKDTNNLIVLKQYYYKVVAVDKGGLKSNPSRELTDIIFDKPFTIFPSDGAEVDYFNELVIKTISVPAQYKIIIQRNEYFDIIKEIEFSSDETKLDIRIPLAGITFEPFRTYYWRAVTYSGFSRDPNSFTSLSSFVIVPD
jgi:hypothetical protein